MPKDARLVEIVHGNVTIPSAETTYWCSLHELPQETETKHHIIQYEALIKPGSEALVHHMEVFHCEVPVEAVLPDWNGPCVDKARPPALDACKRVIAAWAMGAGVSCLRAS